MNSLRTTVSTFALVATLAASAVTDGAALAGDGSYQTYEIPSQSLDRAIREFSNRAGIQVLYSQELVNKTKSTGLSGRYSTEVGLTRLLQSAGLSFRRSDRNTYVIIPAQNSGFQTVSMAVTNVEASYYDDNLDIYADDAAAEDVSLMLEEVTVVGTRLKGVSEEALPVSVMRAQDIANIGAVNMQDILSFIPSVGDFEFQDSSTGTNAARGDVAGANLRGLGSGNTLVLINGRRMVIHPTFESINNVPSIFYNVNSLPSAATQRIEVLRDGASALYGADATGGVLNFVPDTDFEGMTLSTKYGFGENTSYNEMEISGRGGWSFNEGRTHVGIFANYYNRGRVELSELDPLYYELDRRGTEDLPEDWRDDSQLRNDSSSTPYAVFSFGEVNPDGIFVGSTYHVDPTTGDLVAGSSSERYNFNEVQSVTPGVNRVNVMSTLTHDFDSGLSLYADAFYYQATSKTTRAASPIDAGLAFIIVPADAPSNPLGQDALITSWRPADLGGREIEVDQDTYRVSLGLKGEAYGWDWDSAVVYSEATATDTEFNRQGKTLFVQSVNAGQINPFLLPGENTEAALASIRIEQEDFRKSTLATWDLRLTKNDLFSLPAGDVGAAFGIEWRRESYLDDRDARVDGSTPFIDGDIFDYSDLIGVSATFDSSAARHTASAYGELSIPLVSAANSGPLAKALELQIAARYENTSDFGDTFKPKFGFRYEPITGFSFRGSYAKGFRAPNLPSMNQGTIIRRSLGIEDPLREEVTGAAIDTGDTYRIETRLGNENLAPENTDTYTLGAVYVPEGTLNGLRVSFDWWRIEQTDVVGALEASDELALDALLRSQGSFNPNVIRADLTADDIAAFAAWNAGNPGDQRTPVGIATNIFTQYVNLEPRTVEGWDASFNYETDETSAGAFRFKLDVSHITKFEQQGLAITDLLRRNGNPKWRATASVGWDLGNFSTNVSMRHVSSVYDSSLDQSDTSGASGTVLGDGKVYWNVDSWTTYNATVRYDFTEATGFMEGTSFTVGVRNLTNAKPPFADESFGYLTGLHNSYGRVWWFQASKTF